MTSREAAGQIEQAIRCVDPRIEVVSYTMADGGEGTAAAFCDVCGGRMVQVRTSDAYGKKIEASYALIDDDQTAVIDVASSIGILVKNEILCWRAAMASGPCCWMRPAAAAARSSSG